MQHSQSGKSLFYVTTAICHFLLLLNSACGQSAAWALSDTLNEPEVTTDGFHINNEL
jgi:hypothetical protein